MRESGERRAEGEGGRCGDRDRFLVPAVINCTIPTYVKSQRICLSALAVAVAVAG